MQTDTLWRIHEDWTVTLTVWTVTVTLTVCVYGDKSVIARVGDDPPN